MANKPNSQMLALVLLFEARLILAISKTVGLSTKIISPCRAYGFRNVGFKRKVRRCKCWKKRSKISRYSNKRLKASRYWSKKLPVSNKGKRSKAKMKFSVQIKRF